MSWGTMGDSEPSLLWIGREYNAVERPWNLGSALIWLRAEFDLFVLTLNCSVLIGCATLNK